MIIEGLIKGFDSKRRQVKASLVNLTRDIERSFDSTTLTKPVAVAYSPAVTPSGTYRSTAAAVPSVVNITIEGGFFNEVEMGRQIDTALSKYYRAGTKVNRRA
jgi:hypothetical protein